MLLWYCSTIQFVSCDVFTILHVFQQCTLCYKFQHKAHSLLLSTQFEYTVSTTARMSAKLYTALTWISTNFQYPTCRKVSKLGDLKTGVAVAEILTEMLPTNLQQVLLTKIEISKLHADACIANWRVIKQALLQYLKNTNAQQLMTNLIALAPETLYYRDQDLIKFINDILMHLWHSPPIIMDQSELLKYSGAIKSHLSSMSNKSKSEMKQQTIINNTTNINLSQLSDIANTSCLMGPTQTTMLHNTTHDGHDKIVVLQQRPQLQCRTAPVPLSQVSQLQAWMISKLGEEVMFWEPHEQLGSLVNAIFCSSRLNCPIVKDAQFKHGALFVYKKVLEFIVQNNQAERVSKINALEIMRAIQELGIVRESEYWRLINDLHDFDMTKGKLFIARSNNQDHVKCSNIDKQNKNLNINCLSKDQSKKVLQPCKTSKSLQNAALIVKPQVLQAIEKWLSQQMGLEHSIAKIHSTKQAYSNPLINGTIAATMLMRFKLGKATINKSPICIQEVRSNWEMINKTCCLRNYESLKPVCAYLYRINTLKADQECINKLLHYLNQFKLQYQRKQAKLKKVQPSTQCNQCEDEYVVKLTYSASEIVGQKLELREWLTSNFGIRMDQILTVAQLTSICRELLRLNIYKQTTPRIQASNVDKILGQLRRIGLGDYYLITKEQLMDSNAQYLRWKILADLKWLIEGKIVFCRA